MKLVPEPAYRETDAAEVDTRDATKPQSNVYSKFDARTTLRLLSMLANDL